MFDVFFRDPSNARSMILFPKLTPLVLLAGLLAGCVGYRAKPISAAKTAAGFEARSLSDPGLRGFLRENGKGAISSWNFPALTIAAFYFHPDVNVAQAQIDLAKAALITAGERPNPTLSMSPQFAHPLSAGTYGFTFDVPIETAGKRGHRIMQARHGVAAAGFNLQAAKWQVRSRLRKNLVDLFGATERESAFQRQQSNQDDVLKLTEQRVDAGEASRFEARQARLLANQTRLLLAEAHKQSAEGRVSVADAIGVSSRALDGVALDMAAFNRAPTPRGLGAVRSQALRTRADILGALADYAVAEAALRLEIAKQYPDLHLSPGYSLDSGTKKWEIAGVSLTLPILNQNRGPIAEAEAKRAQAAAKFQALQARVLGEIDRAVVGYRAAYEKLQIADALFATQEKHLKSAESLFKAGESDRLAFTSAQVELDVAAVSRLEALVEAQQSLGALEDALQSPLDRE
jgi:outer membrane protein, heavy metal efflux system